jgi:hypothetical protein
MAQEQGYGGIDWTSGVQAGDRLRTGTFREASVPVALLSMDDDQHTSWFRRPARSSLSLIGLLLLPFRRRRRAAPRDPQLAASRRVAPPRASVRRLAMVGTAAGVFVAAGVLLGPDSGFGEGGPDFTIGRVPGVGAPGVPDLDPEPERPGAVPEGVGATASSGSGAAVLGAPPRGGNSGPGSGTGPDDRPPVVVDPRDPGPPGGPPTETTAAQPLAQVNAAALAGLDVRLGIGLGDGSCTGLKLGDLAVGCMPPGRDSFGVTASTGGSLLPPLTLSLP